MEWSGGGFKRERSLARPGRRARKILAGRDPLPAWILQTRYDCLAPRRAPRLRTGGPGLEVSRGHLFQDRRIERLIGENPLEAQILLLQPLHPLGLIHAQSAVFILPAIVRLLGDAELPAGVERGQASAGVELNRSQMLNNLFGRIPFLGHAADLPDCDPV